MDGSRYTGDLFRYHVQILNSYMNAEFLRTFQSYQILCAFVVPDHELSQLAEEVLEYQAYTVEEIVEPLISTKIH